MSLDPPDPPSALDPTDRPSPGRPFKVVRTDRELEMPLVDATLRAWGGELVLLPDGVEPAMLARELADADLLLMCYTRIDAAALAGAGRLKAIVKYGVGIDAIDHAAARARRIPVVNVPEYAEETVAEGAFSLLMALHKRLIPIHHAVQRDGWIWPEARWLGRDLAGRTLGLVGLGRIGRSMARMALGFRMRVLAVDPALSDANTPRGVERCESLDAMIPRCDALSLHCVLNEQTRHLIGARQLSAMKPDAVLVNVARGELIDEAALVPVLLEHRIAGAALDVYGQEPLAPSGHPLSALFGLDHVILFPHLTFFTHEAMRRLEDDTLARCREALEGRPLTVRSADPRLRAQTHGVRFADPPPPPGGP